METRFAELEYYSPPSEHFIKGYQQKTQSIADQFAKLREEFFSEVDSKSFLGESGVKIVRFDTERFPIRQTIIELLRQKGYKIDGDDLSQINLELSPEVMTYDGGHTDMSRVMFDRDFASKYYEIYHGLVKHIAEEVIGQDCYFQSTITNRYHFSSDMSNFDEHYPFYHSDCFYGHPPKCFNVYLPITDHNICESFVLADLPETLRLFEAYPNMEELYLALDEDPELLSRVARRCKPAHLDYGEFFLFDTRCMHSVTKLKRDSSTRVSMDFRLITVDDYNSMDVELNAPEGKKSFSVGTYYHEKSTSQLP